MLSRVGMVFDVLAVLHTLGNMYPVAEILEERHDHAAVLEERHLVLDEVPVGVVVLASW